MSKRVSIDQMADEIARQLAAWNDGVAADTREAVKEAAKQCRDEIREASPVLTGHYKKGWTDVVSYEGQDDIRITVHNKTDYQLTHLLEYGHAKRGGGRVEGKTHIAPAEQHAIETLGKKIEAAVKK